VALLSARSETGALYGYRVTTLPAAAGHRFNPNKLLLDPYAKALVGRLRCSDANFGYKIGAKQEDYLSTGGTTPWPCRNAK